MADKDQPQSQTPGAGKPGQVPPPGSLPKIPQTIFNFEMNTPWHPRGTSER